MGIRVQILSKPILQYQHVGWTAIAAVHNSDSGVEWM